METDTESTLQEYQIQLEQVTQKPKNNQKTLNLYTIKCNKKVELALKSKPDNDELLKLKEDLLV